MGKGMLFLVGLVVMAALISGSETKTIPGSSKEIWYKGTGPDAEGINQIYYDHESTDHLYQREDPLRPLPNCTDTESPTLESCSVCKMEDVVFAWCNLTHSSAGLTFEGENYPVFTECARPLLTTPSPPGHPEEHSARPPLTTPSPPGHPEEHSGTNLWAVFGCLALVVIIAAAVCYWQREKLSSVLSEWRRSSHAAGPPSETKGIEMKGPANAE